MNKICCIVGGVATSCPLPQDAFMIAADEGYRHLKAVGRTPDLAVGDFDSLGLVPQDVPTVVHPAQKDDSDTMLAVKEGIERGYRIFLLYGCMGGDRFEHTIANLQTLSYIAAAGGMGFLVDEGTVITAIRNSKLMFDADEKGEISVFCLGADAENVNIIGRKYPLTNATLTAHNPLGLSNRFEGRVSYVAVGSGTLHILWHKSTAALVQDLTGEIIE